MRQSRGIGVSTLCRIITFLGAALILGPSFAEATTADARVTSQLSNLRMPFIENQGQVDAEVSYYARTFAGTVFVTKKGEVVYTLPGQRSRVERGKAPVSLERGWSLTETLSGGTARPIARDRSATEVSYFLGSNPDRWQVKQPTYDQIDLGEVWAGINVSLHARGNSIEKVFTVEPGASVDSIRVWVSGANDLSVDSRGALVAKTEIGPITFSPPVAFQERDGVRQSVPVTYRLTDREYAFSVGAYDPKLPLVIDPLLQSTYLGGGLLDVGRAIAMSLITGDIYVTGLTASTNFPGTAGGAQPAKSLLTDAFVARLSGDLKTLIQATYLGGLLADLGTAIAIHPTTGDVYVAGATDSANFPGTAGGAQPLLGGSILGASTNAFIARLPSTLTSLTQATYLGGRLADQASALAINSTTGDVYVTGQATSTDFPGTAGGAQPAIAGSPGVTNAFIARLSGDLKTLTQATYLGGSGVDLAHAMVLAATGDVYVAGEATSTNFPNTAGGAQPNNLGSTDAFVARLPSTLTSLTQATYLGGGLADVAFGLAIGPVNSDIYVTGSTASTDFIGTSGGFQPSLGGGLGVNVTNAFVARLSSTLTSLTQSTYLGGTGVDLAHAIAMTPNGDVYVAGEATSTDFPGTAGGAQPTHAGGLNLTDAFVARMRSTLKSLIQATYLGGSSEDVAFGLVIAPDPDVYVVGSTASTNFPGTAGGAQPANAGLVDAFVSRLTFGLAQVDPPLPDRDFNGDGMTDILLYHPASQTYAMFLMIGGAVKHGFCIVGAASPWSIAGVGDFNDDGRADILWRNTATGDVGLWLMNGGTVIGSAVVSTIPLAWTIVGVGDFNGDGRADILWRNTATGEMAIWLMDGGAVIGSAVVNTIPLAWTIVGVGDFNGDRKADILWRNTVTGETVIWLMNGGTILSSFWLGVISSDWTISQIGDFNGDAKADILWQKPATGDIYLWLMDGGAIIATPYVGTAPGWVTK